MPPSTSPDRREVVSLMAVDDARNDVFCCSFCRMTFMRGSCFDANPFFRNVLQLCLLSREEASSLAGTQRRGALLPAPISAGGCPRNAPPARGFARQHSAGSLGESGSQPPQTPAFPGRKRCFRLPGFGRLLGGLPTQSAVLACLGLEPGLRVWLATIACCMSNLWGPFRFRRIHRIRSVAAPG